MVDVILVTRWASKFYSSTPELRRRNLSGGLSLTRDGSLDIEKSFQRIDYFSLFHDVVVRNNAARDRETGRSISLPHDTVGLLSGTGRRNRTLADDAIWLSAGPICRP
jgi:hypothetical protein